VDVPSARGWSDADGIVVGCMASTVCECRTKILHVCQEISEEETLWTKTTCRELIVVLSVRRYILAVRHVHKYSLFFILR